MTQKELSMILGVTPQFLSKWKLGKSGLKVSTAIRWSVLLNTDFKILMTAAADPKIRSKMLGLKNR